LEGRSESRHSSGSYSSSELEEGLMISLISGFKMGADKGSSSISLLRPFL